MQPTDIKKLITGFLVLSIIVSSSAFTLSYFLTSKANTNPYNTSQTSSILNAFSSNKPQNLNLASPGGGNLTQGLAESIANKLIEGNPSGPSATGTNQGIQIPGDLNSVISSYLDGGLALSSSTAQFSADNVTLKIKKGASAEEMKSYIEGIKNILDSFSGSDFKNFDNKITSGDATSITAGAIFYSNLENQLTAMEVPEQFASLHKHLISSVLIPKTIFSQNIDADPLLAFSVLQSAKQALSDIEVSLVSDIQELTLTLPKTMQAFPKSSGFLIPTAYATGIPVIDIPEWILQGLKFIEDKIQTALAYTNTWISSQNYYTRIIVEKLKDKLLKKVVDTILNWSTSGGRGGKPTYVVNWNSFLQKTYTDIAGQLLAEQSKSMCAPFRLRLTDQLRLMNGVSGYSLGDTSGGAGCALEDIVSNVQDFYKDFGNGGWDAFTAASMPGSNYYGSLYFMNQQISAQAKAKKEAAQAQALAGNGDLGTEYCLDKSTPQNGYCADGTQPEITTPGSVISQITAAGISAPIARITAATDWTSLAVQLASWAITKLAASGNKGLSHGNITDSSKLDPKDVCASYKDPTEKQKCIDDVNGMNNQASGPSGSRTLLIQEATKELQDSSSALDYLLVAKDAASSTIAVLSAIVAQPTCSVQAPQANDELANLNQEYADILGKIDAAISKVSALQTFLDDITNHTPDNDEDFFTQKLIDFQNDFGGPGTAAQESGNAQSLVQTLQQKLQDATDTLTSCSK